MKKVFLFFLSITVVLSLCLVPLAGCTKREDQLKIYNWEDYMDEDILDEFIDEYNEANGTKFKVKMQNFDTNETMYSKVSKGGADYDLLCPSDYMIEKMVKGNLLAELDYNNIPNYANVDANTVGHSFDPDQKYSVPYMWGTMGILYNKEKISQNELDTYGWGVLWNKGNNAQISKKILMKDSVRDSFAIASIYANRDSLLTLDVASRKSAVQGYINDYSSAGISAAEAVLKAQKTALKGYEVDSGKDDMVTGSAYANLAWSGDAIYAIAESAAANGGTSKLGYYIPMEGSNLWFDGWVIPKKAVNKSLAEAFINFLCRPDIAYRNMVANGYTSAIEKAEIAKVDGVDSKILNDTVQYPTQDEINRCGVMKDFGDKIADVNSMWERVKSYS